MVDLSTTIIARSDQLNSDDLIAGPITIHITKMSANPSAPEQPISISYEGDNNKPFKPCKTCRRILVYAWGADGSKFAGRSMTLYRDATVKWGGFEVGGIRISHMSDIAKPLTMSLTTSKANRKPFTVQPLVMNGGHQEALAEPSAELIELAETASRGGMSVLEQFWAGLSKPEKLSLKSRLDALKADAKKADEPEPDDDFNEPNDFKPISAPAGEADNTTKGTSEH